MTETAGREGGTCLSWKNEWLIISRHFEPIILGLTGDHLSKYAILQWEGYFSWPFRRAFSIHDEQHSAHTHSR